MVLWTGLNIFLFVVSIVCLAVGGNRAGNSIMSGVFEFFTGIILLIVCVVSASAEFIQWMWF